MPHFDDHHMTRIILNTVATLALFAYIGALLALAV